MKVNVSRKTMLVITVLVFIIVILIVGRIVCCILSTADYEKVSATVQEMDWHNSEYNSDSSSIIHKIKCQYYVNDREYSFEFETPVKWGLKEGKNITLYYNPDNHEEIRAKLYTENLVLVCTLLLLLICALMTWKAGTSK